MSHNQDRQLGVGSVRSVGCFLVPVVYTRVESVTLPSEKVTFSREKVTFSGEKVVFSDEKMTFSALKVILLHINMQIIIHSCPGT